MKNFIKNNFSFRLLLLLGVSMFFMAPLLLNSYFFLGTDVGVWKNDYQRLTKCLESKTVPCGQISQFPVGYLMNSYFLNILSKIGVGFERSLSFINAAFLILPFFFIVGVRGRVCARSLVPIYGVALMFSSLPPFYIYAGALEVQAGVMIGLFLSSIMLLYEKTYENKSFVFTCFLLLSAFLFPLYKDTNLITIACSLLVLFLVQEFLPTGIAKRKLFSFSPIHYISIATGLFLSSVAIFGMNIFKYKTILPRAYLNVASLTSPSLSKSGEFFIASIFSANGGIVIFWFSAFFIAIFLIKCFKMGLSTPAILLSIFFSIASLAGFSLWWAPFGWDSWGNRLMIPPMLASLILIITTANPKNKTSATSDSEFRSAFIQSLTSFSRRKLFYYAPIMFFLFLSLYYTVISYYADRSVLMADSLFEGKACVEMIKALNDDGGQMGLEFWRSNYYYSCADERFLYFPKYNFFE